MGALKSLLNYAIVVVVSLCISLFVLQDAASVRLIEAADKSMLAWKLLLQKKLKVELPVLQIEKHLTIDTSLLLEKLVWRLFSYLPYISVLGCRAHLRLYFFLIGLTLVLQLPFYADRLEAFLPQNIDRLLIMGIAGYASTL